MKTVLIDLKKYRQHENNIYRKSLNFLSKDERGKAHIELFNIAVSTNFSWIRQNQNPNENEMTIQFIGARMFNDAMTAYHDSLSGYYQSSFSAQRNLIEMQFLLDYFRTNKEMIKVWRESTNNQRYKKFGPHVLYKILDERDGFLEGKRKSDYQRFCELATHVSFPGMKLMANDKNQIEAGPFYNKKMVSNTIYELNKRYVYSVISLSSLLEAKEVGAIKIIIDLAEKFDAVFDYTISKTKNMEITKSLLQKALQEANEPNG